ncbi:Putative SAM-dependent methyltransferase [gamma proteobacterium HdN1]|nr:Putative SAM-dependent methyltransferase [gamma proteobacterium HdN1]
MSAEFHRDDIFSEQQRHLVDFTFDEQVACVFPDMIRRSVPGYETVISMTGVFARQFTQPNSRIYDLGCSLGASTLAMATYVCADQVRADQVGADQIEFVAVDNAQAMLDKCRIIVEAKAPNRNVRYLEADIRDVPIHNASLVVLNFTLQFIPVADRLALLKKIAEGLKPGGALVLSEKIAYPDTAQQQLLTDLHHEFKRANGYSDMEISGKRQAIENVLIPESPQTHEQRLKQAGFANATLWFQCFTFASWVATKS